MAVSTDELTARLPSNRPRFTPEQAREAAAKSTVVRAQRRAERAEAKAQLTATVQALQLADIGSEALSGVVALARAALQGNIPVPENALERKRLLEAAEILHRIARLEMGQSTSNAAHLAVDASSLTSRAAELQADLARITDVVDVPGE